MNKNPYVVTESFFPKEDNFNDVLNIMLETSDLSRVDGFMMSMVLKPEQKNGPLTSITMWESREHFTNFMKSEHAQEIMKSGLSEKVKSWTTDIKASLYTAVKIDHIESHD